MGVQCLMSGELWGVCVVNVSLRGNDDVWYGRAVSFRRAVVWPETIEPVGLMLEKFSMKVEF